MMDTEKEIVKPTLVARQEFIEDLLKLINGSGVPLIVIHPVLESVADNVNKAIQRQYEIEKNQYEAMVAVKNTADTEGEKKDE